MLACNQEGARSPLTGLSCRRLPCQRPASNTAVMCKLLLDASVMAQPASLHKRCRRGVQVQALDSLAKALHVEVLELRRERARALASRGLWGHLKNLLGYLLSAYCLFK